MCHNDRFWARYVLAVAHPCSSVGWRDKCETTGTTIYDMRVDRYKSCVNLPKNVINTASPCTENAVRGMCYWRNFPPTRWTQFYRASRDGQDNHRPDQTTHLGHTEPGRPNLPVGGRSRLRKVRPEHRLPKQKVTTKMPEIWRNAANRESLVLCAAVAVTKTFLNDVTSVFKKNGSSNHSDLNTSTPRTDHDQQ